MPDEPTRAGVPTGHSSLRRAPVNALFVVVTSVCESLGVGLLGGALLRALRRGPIALSLVAVVVITVFAMDTSVITTVVVTRSASLPVTLNLIVNFVAGVVSIGIGLLLGRSVLRGSRRLADATRALGQNHGFQQPDDPPTAELAELARQLAISSAKLAESRRREQAAEASRRRLVASISHDLRSPLARLRAISESIEDGVTVDLDKYLGRIRSDTERLSEMVDDLFELSRIQEDMLRLTPRHVALGDLVSDAVAALDMVAADRPATLAATTIEPVVVSVDERAMTRVLNNLLVNAIRCSPANSTVSVSVRAADGGAAVSVVDECGGIPQEDIPLVFDTGWRGQTERDTGGDQGAGLGLAIVHGIVQAHQGRVSVRNVPGGCCFDVWLPLPD